MTFRVNHHFRVSIVLLSLFGLFILSCEAQLPDGSIAPDFTATDINGVEHNLYSYLDSGYQVILDFSATWCGPCWSYHEAGILSELHNTYGPDGTDEIRVFYLEADDVTTDADLNGTGGFTAGDWVTGTPYTIIDNAGSIFDDYAGSYYPTTYTVCPSRIITESGHASVADHAAIFQANNCAAPSFPNDGALVGYAGETFACGDAPISLAVTLMNIGVDPLTSCTITAYEGATAVGSTDWTGNLDTYATEEVLVTTTTIDASTEFTFEITSTDDNAVNNVASGVVNTHVASPNNMRFTLNLDAFPGEVIWALLDDMGNVVESGGPYSDVGAEYIYDWTLDLGCYTFVIEDAYGDGLNSSWYNGTGPDGSFSLDAMNGNAVASNLLSYSSPDWYTVIEFHLEVISNYSPCEVDEDNDWVCDDIDTCIGIEDECGVCNGPGAIYECGCEDIPFGQCNCEGGSWDFNENGICDDQEVFGCTYVGAVNYLESATTDDGSCFFPCEGEVSSPSEYCLDGTLWDEALGGCVPAPDCLLASDLDANGLVGASDLLLFLTEYGDSLPDADADGICDDIDTCIGIEDECGVCNGPGPTELVIENITVLYDSVYVEQIDQWLVFEVGADTTFSFTCAPLIDD